MMAINIEQSAAQNRCSNIENNIKEAKVQTENKVRELDSK